MTDYLPTRMPTRNRGDTFPRNSSNNNNPGPSLLECRSGSTTSVSRICGSSNIRPSEELNNELKHSKSDDLVLQVQSKLNDFPDPISMDSINLRFSCSSEQILGNESVIGPESPDGETEGDFLDRDTSVSGASHLNKLKKGAKREVNYDFIDPEDSIRDMITENDFYR